MDREQIFRSLEEGTSTNQDLGRNGQYYNKERFRIMVEGDQMILHKTQEYNGEEDMSSEWLDSHWTARAPLTLLEEKLADLLSGKPVSCTVNTSVHEAGHGRAPYSESKTGERDYVAPITLTITPTPTGLNLSLTNPNELRFPDQL